MATVFVYLVRHGETDENRAGIMQGQLDTQLNAMGEQQANLAAEALREIPFSYAFTSDLSRASKTAEAILRFHPTVSLIPQTLLRERSMGELEGLHASKYNKRAIPPSVESATNFIDRTLQWWDSTILPLSQTPQPRVSSPEDTAIEGNDDTPITVLAVTHGAYISTLVHFGLIGERQFAGRGKARGPVFNASISVVELDAGGELGEIHSFAAIRHLLDPALKKNADDLEEKES